jgi:MFS family permease
MVGQMAHPAARARAVARATLLGYFGYFFGPPFVGFLAGQFGLRAAFVFAAVLLASVPIWAHVLRRQR